MRGSMNETSPFLALETHFLNAFHSGLYISAAELAAIGKRHSMQLPLKTRELMIKKLLNDANEEGKLSSVIADIAALIEGRIAQMNELARDYPGAASFLQSLIQKASSSNLLLKRQQKANPYE